MQRFTRYNPDPTPGAIITNPLTLAEVYAQIRKNEAEQRAQDAAAEHARTHNETPHVVKGPSTPGKPLPPVRLADIWGKK